MNIRFIQKPVPTFWADAALRMTRFFDASTSPKTGAHFLG
jgi:hypothetical protein